MRFCFNFFPDKVSKNLNFTTLLNKLCFYAVFSSILILLVPEITCPHDRMISLPKDSNRTSLGEDFVDAITNMGSYETIPKGVDANYLFSIGEHRIEYIARNKYGDVDRCSYRVKVVGKSSYNVLIRISKTIIDNHFNNLLFTKKYAF